MKQNANVTGPFVFNSMADDDSIRTAIESKLAALDVVSMGCADSGYVTENEISALLWHINEQVREVHELFGRYSERLAPSDADKAVEKAKKVAGL